MKDIKGQTYYAAEGGGMETHEMKKGSIFKEDVDGRWKRMRFTLPALQPGSIIEYRYKVLSKNPRFFPEWTFQRSEPVLRSEYQAEIPEIYRYVSIYQGQLQPDVVEQKPYARTMYWTIDMREDNLHSRRFNDKARATTQVDGIRYRWVMQEVPALRREPFMTTPEDFRAKIRFELAEIGQPTDMVRLSVGMEDVDDLIEDLGRALRASQRG